MAPVNSIEEGHTSGRGEPRSVHTHSMQDSDEEYEAALERRRLEVEAEKRMQQEEDARLLRALTAQQELPGACLSPALLFARVQLSVRRQAAAITTVCWKVDNAESTGQPRMHEMRGCRHEAASETGVCLSCTEATIASAAEEEEAYSSEDEATATPLSSTAALTALSGAISEADFPRASGADARAPQRPLARGSSSVADDEQAVSEAGASVSAVDAAGDAKKKRNRKQRYKDNLVRASRPPASQVSQ